MTNVLIEMIMTQQEAVLLSVPCPKYSPKPKITHMQRRIPLAIPAIHIRPTRQQLLQNPFTAATRRQMHRRLSVLILRIQIPIATLQQLRHHRHIALPGRPMQQIRAPMAARIVRRLLAAVHKGSQLRDQPMGGAAIVLDQRVQPVDRLLLVDREERILAVAPDLVVVDLVVMEHRQHIVTVRAVALAHQKRAVRVLDVGAFCACVC